TVMATKWRGAAEYMDPEYSFPLSFRLVGARGTESKSFHYFGQWAEPDYGHLRLLLRWLVEHRTEAEEKGRIAAKRVCEFWTWERTASQLVHNLDELAQE